MTLPVVPDLPTAPSPTDDVPTFNSKMFAWIVAIADWTTAVNALSAAIDAIASVISGNASSASASESAAAASASSASSSANAAAASAGAVLWVSGTTYANGARVLSPANGQLYRRTAASGSGTTDPSLDYSNYARVFAEPELVTAESFFF